MAIQFRDRALKDGEHSHYYCDVCGEELHPDFAYSHKCSSFRLSTRGWDNPMQNQYFNKLW